MASRVDQSLCLREVDSLSDNAVLFDAISTRDADQHDMITLKGSVCQLTINKYEELLSEYQEDQRAQKELQLLQGWQRKKVQPRRTVTSFADLMLAPPPPEEGILLGGYVLEPVTEDDLNMAMYEPKSFYQLQREEHNERMELLAGKQHKLLNSLDDEALSALNKGAGVLGQLVEQVAGKAGGMSEAVKKVGQDALAIAASRAPEESSGYVNLRTGLPCIPSPDHVYCVATPTTTTTEAPPSLIELRKYKRKREEEAEKRRRVELEIHREQQQRQYNPYDQPVYFEDEDSQPMKPIDAFKKKMSLNREKAGEMEEHLAGVATMQEAPTILKFAKHTAQNHEQQVSFSSGSMSETPLTVNNALLVARRYDRRFSETDPHLASQFATAQEFFSGLPGETTAEEAAVPRLLKDYSMTSYVAGSPAPGGRTRVLATAQISEQHFLEEPCSVVPYRPGQASGRKETDATRSTRRSDRIIDSLPFLRDMRKSNLPTTPEFVRDRSAEPATSRSSKTHPPVASRPDDGSFPDLTSPGEAQARNLRRSDGRQSGFSSIPPTGSSYGTPPETRAGTKPGDEHKDSSFIIQGARQFQSRIQATMITPKELSKYTQGNKPSSLASSEDLMKTEKERAKRERQEQRLSRLIDNFTAASYAEELRNAARATGDPLPSDAVVGPFLRASALPPFLKEKVERTQHRKEQKREEKDARQESNREERQAAHDTARVQQLESNLSDLTLTFIRGYLNSDTSYSPNENSKLGSKGKLEKEYFPSEDQTLQPLQVRSDTNNSTDGASRQPSSRVGDFSDLANQRSGITARSREHDGMAGKERKHIESSSSPFPEKDQGMLLHELHSARVVWLDGEDNENPFQIHPRVYRILPSNIDASFF
ncbi:conserved hypothetical protein [Neospora caninum Liverpool]|uniref:Uncharacterized protein n=1 Tax=Neospora caninum (strain Liverpool) TaxID=572307 RepID=F0VM22_NEOCL|nr:conserved hypothetical protein [Neospora caninum Liverpool]CBZ54300.1 conserved hypothetical protein [Neospora caninum Liverpool]CEL69006.1 TPA: hypothetical protein BN1204_047320 [Neospora caninum Liverpool]|eukprot:XP_003884331.1 conserved hypothetical protein [Neospora caninum Liverpool]